jgi:RNA polymerase sigma-70 factor (ECF subfamily)
LEKDREKFITVLENHKRIIFKIVNSYCREFEDRQDLIQEIIIQLWLSFEKYNDQFKLSTWIYRIALNTSISFYRKNKRRKEKTISLTSVLEGNFMEADPYLKNTDFQKLEGFIQQLKDLDKAIILLYLDDIGQREIAEIMGISQTNVATKINRIKKILKRKFQLT